jgi:ribosomal protein L11 methyltransferase
MREMVFDVAQEWAERLSDALIEAGALSASVEDADQGTEAESPLYGEPGMPAGPGAWQRNRLVAMIGRDTEPEALAGAARKLAGIAAPVAFIVRDVPEQDWVRVTQSQFAPIAIGRRVCIVPSWHEVPDDGRDIVIRLDPGLAFGTGSHPTTRLCMQWLEDHVRPESTVLDYGCGSGILAIGARLLGAGRTVGVDIDPAAVEAASANALKNGCACEFRLAEDTDTFTADIVIANILSNPLVVLAPMLARRVNPGGRIALSGVLERQAVEVARAYAPWVSLSVWGADEGWVCLHGRVDGGHRAIGADTGGFAPGRTGPQS